MTRYNCGFSYYCRGVKTADVTIANGVVTTVPHTDNWLDLPFGMVPDRLVTRKVIDLFYEQNCVPEHRANLGDFLAHYGIEKFDPFAICRITNGAMADSPYTISWHDGGV
jgi:hypothetical protein